MGSTKKKEVIICNLHIIFLEQLHINDSGSIRYASDNLKYGDHSGDIDIYVMIILKRISIKMIGECKLNSLRPRLGLYEHSSYNFMAVNMKYHYLFQLHTSQTRVNINLTVYNLVFWVTSLHANKFL